MRMASPGPTASPRPTARSDASATELKPAPTGAIRVLGPDGRQETIRISHLSTPESIKDCLRSVFGIVQSGNLFLRDNDGCAVPLDFGLTMQANVVYKLEVKIARAESNSLDKSMVVKRNNSCTAVLPTHTSAYAEECEFWCSLVGGFCGTNAASGNGMIHRKLTFGRASQSDSGTRLGERTSFFDVDPDLLRLADYDTSPHRIDTLYASWAGDDSVLKRIDLARHLEMDHNLGLTDDKLMKALQRVGHYVQSRGSVGADEHSAAEDKAVVPYLVFVSFWQRLMLGAVLNEAYLNATSDVKTPNLKLIGYNDHYFNEAVMSEEEFFFGGNLRFKSGREQVSCWARIDHAGPERLIRMGVKFFLHPIATEEAINVARAGLTKVDLYRHQYFVTLEMYALESTHVKNTYGRSNSRSLNSEPPRVSDQIVRSVVFLVATGNPSKGHRDWLLTVANSEQGSRSDPLDRFRSGTGAAIKVLNSVRNELKSHGRLREYQADYLLYTVLERTTNEIMPVCHAYGHRLRWLQNLLDHDRLKVPSDLVDEVSKMRLEFQELRQWVGQLRGVLRHIEKDCKGAAQQGTSDTAWNFGRWAGGAGKELLLSLHSTQDSLDRSMDKLAQLDELANSFCRDYDRHRDGFTNSTLSVLTVATAIFMPAQLLAGVYGMNFEKGDGDPALPELRWQYGYLAFWLIVGTFAIVSGIIAFCCLRHAWR